MSSGSERKTGKAKVEGSPSGRDSGRNGEERSSPGAKSGRIIEIKTVLRIMIVVLLCLVVQNSFQDKFCQCQNQGLFDVYVTFVRYSVDFDLTPTSPC